MIEEEIYVGLITHKSSKPSRQYIEAEEEARTVGTIRIKLIVSCTPLRLSKCIVIPQLEYYIQKPDMEN